MTYFSCIIFSAICVGKNTIFPFVGNVREKRKKTKLVSLCRRTVLYTTISYVHATSHTMNIYKFQDTWKCLRRVKARTNIQADNEPRNKKNQCLNTFQLCWTVLKYVYHTSIVMRKREKNCNFIYSTSYSILFSHQNKSDNIWTHTQKK